MRMYVKVMAAVIACILLSGEALSAFATTPATENLSWFKKKKKKPEEREEKSKSDYEKLVEGSKTTKGMFAVHQKKNDFYFEIYRSLFAASGFVCFSRNNTECLFVAAAKLRPFCFQLKRCFDAAVIFQLYLIGSQAVGAAVGEPLQPAAACFCAGYSCSWRRQRRFRTGRY